ncbi:hypothetical protein BABINDRAFT_130831 [Babjeviella inositovora NRRL Y-12698]|uniref:HMG box domain-containing protein n=1 Tax=Babjeviella inositovora NRRL Y-12698 TaxID=984486 RepID=A0A1E3QRB5_9ASCO|nr:uncharacterized protein BABINDRAFT_130831 [Babjeviella inositovora NRRL Y-12698]ODQ80243.1 hypothetical protein BABINDRAFT_130831 [Babjeviella inositovora NRRL Y-12698]
MLSRLLQVRNCPRSTSLLRSYTRITTRVKNQTDQSLSAKDLLGEEGPGDKVTNEASKRSPDLLKSNYSRFLDTIRGFYKMHSPEELGYIAKGGEQADNLPDTFESGEIEPGTEISEERRYSPKDKETHALKGRDVEYEAYPGRTLAENAARVSKATRTWRRLIPRSTVPKKLPEPPKPLTNFNMFLTEKLAVMKAGMAPGEEFATQRAIIELSKVWSEELYRDEREKYTLRVLRAKLAYDARSQSLPPALREIYVESILELTHYKRIQLGSEIGGSVRLSLIRAQGHWEAEYMRIKRAIDRCQKKLLADVALIDVFCGYLAALTMTYRKGEKLDWFSAFKRAVDAWTILPAARAYPPGCSFTLGEFLYNLGIPRNSPLGTYLGTVSAPSERTDFRLLEAASWKFIRMSLSEREEAVRRISNFNHASEREDARDTKLIRSHDYKFILFMIHYVQKLGGITGDIEALRYKGEAMWMRLPRSKKTKFILKHAPDFLMQRANERTQPSSSTAIPTKRPINSFLRFQKKFRDEALYRDPRLTLPDIGKMAAESWRTLAPEARQAYTDDYKAEYAVWKQQKHALKPEEPRPEERAKRPLNGYLRYLICTMKAIKKANPEIDVLASARIIGQKWRNLPPEEKGVYLQAARDDWTAFFNERKQKA